MNADSTKLNFLSSSFKDQLKLIGMTVGFLLPFCIVVFLRWRVSLFAPFFMFADQDSVLVGEALGFNAGETLRYVDHPGYFTILILSWWIRGLHEVGILTYYSASQLHDINDFTEALFETTAACRALSTIIIATSALLCMTSAIMISRRYLVGLYCGIAYASSYGVILQSLIIRTESLPLLIWWTSVLILIELTRSRSFDRAMIMCMLFGMTLYLQLLSKIQYVMLFPSLLFVPLLYRAFESARSETSLQVDRSEIASQLSYVWIFILLSIALPFLIDISFIYRFNFSHVVAILFLAAIFCIISLTRKYLFHSMIASLAGVSIGNMLTWHPYTTIPLASIINLPERLLFMCNLGKCPATDFSKSTHFFHQVFVNAQSLLFSFREAEKFTFFDLFHGWLIVLAIPFIFLIRLYHRKTTGASYIRYRWLFIQAALIVNLFIVTAGLLFRWENARLVAYYWHFVESPMMIAIIIPISLAFNTRNKFVVIVTLVIVSFFSVFSLTNSLDSYESGNLAGLPSRNVPNTSCGYASYSSTIRKLTAKYPQGCGDFY